MRSAILLLCGCAAASAACTAPCIATGTGLGSTTYSTGAVTMTGAKAFFYALSFLNGNQPTISDSVGNAAPTCLTPEAGAFGGSSVLCYLFNPITDPNQTFTVTGTGSIFSSMQVSGFSTVNLTYTGPTPNLFNGTVITGPTTTYQPGSVTPHAAADLVISVISAGAIGGSTLTINSSFNIAGQQSFSGGTAFGSGLAYLVSPAGAAVNPTWTDNQNEGAALSIASFTVSGPIILTSGGPSIL